jgi:signal transduction histidine kinase
VVALRRNALDGLLVSLAGVVLVTSLAASTSTERYAGALCTLAVLVLLARSHRPPLADLVGFAILAVGGRLEPRAPAPVFLAVLVSFGVAGALPRRSNAVVAWFAGCVAILVIMLGNPYTEGAGDLALTLTFCTIIWAAGLLAAERGRQADEAQERAARVESSRDRALAEATAHERARIAGELHDIVSHGLSIVILQTVAARMALSDSRLAPDDAVDQRLDAVEATARDALGDMRRLLDLLGPDQAGGETGGFIPVLGLAQLPALVQQTRDAGLPVEATYDLRGPEPSAGLDAAAYRIVQEALTNVLKHAPGSRTRVCVSRDEDVLEVAVVNRAARTAESALPGSGYGLIGMRQRAELYGGSFEAGECGDGFAVRAASSGGSRRDPRPRRRRSGLGARRPARHHRPRA